MQRKYIELILLECLKIKEGDSLFVSYDEYTCHDFVWELKKILKELKISDVYFFNRNIVLQKEILENNEIDKLKDFTVFDYSIWDVYAKKGSSFLMLVSEVPEYLSGISEDKLAYINNLKKEQTKEFTKRELNMEIPWCICAVANPYWASSLFPEENAYEKLTNYIYQMCMIDKENPIKSWQEYLQILNERTKKLNDLNIKKLHYTNDLGTDLVIELPLSYEWKSIASERNLVNMPSYEVYCSPNYLKTNGTVYSTKPLVFNGIKIDNFSLTFKDGKVISYEALEGKETLEYILNFDEFSSYLGECALVDYNSPISNTKVVFGSTLFDENATCHLALGAGFPECSLEKEKINKSDIHVDFMIGTSDLTIKGICEDKEVFIFKDGNFVL